MNKNMNTKKNAEIAQNMIDLAKNLNGIRNLVVRHDQDVVDAEKAFQDLYAIFDNLPNALDNKTQIPLTNQRVVDLSRNPVETLEKWLNKKDNARARVIESGKAMILLDEAEKLYKDNVFKVIGPPPTIEEAQMLLAKDRAESEKSEDTSCDTDDTCEQGDDICKGCHGCSVKQNNPDTQKMTEAMDISSEDDPWDNCDGCDARGTDECKYCGAYVDPEETTKAPLTEEENRMGRPWGCVDCVTDYNHENCHHCKNYAGPINESQDPAHQDPNWLPILDARDQAILTTMNERLNPIYDSLRVITDAVNHLTQFVTQNQAPQMMAYQPVHAAATGSTPALNQVNANTYQTPGVTYGLHNDITTTTSAPGGAPTMENVDTPEKLGIFGVETGNITEVGDVEEVGDIRIGHIGHHVNIRVGGNLILTETNNGESGGSND